MPSSSPRRFGPQLWLALFSLLGILGLAVVGVERSSPGPITTVHAGLPDLAGGDNCKACHGGWRRSMTSACVDCHEEVAAQVRQSEGLHGLLAGERAERCASCHIEHHGAEFELVNRASFALAGVPDPDRFDHASIGWTMAGKHLEQSCEKCHEQAEDQPLKEGTFRFLGLSQSCEKCHEDQHQGRYSTDCAACHVQEGFDLHAFVGHEKSLPLIGGHGDLACQTCHAESDPAHSLEALRKPGFHGQGRDCAACHASPHGESFAKGTAKLAKQPEGSACSVCHLAEHRDWQAAKDTLTDSQHARAGFEFDAPHAGLTCEACHADPRQLVELPWTRAQGAPGLALEALVGERRAPRSTPQSLPRSSPQAFEPVPDFGPFLARFPRRDRDGCAACHQDPHAGQFDGQSSTDKTPGLEGCLACHAREAFSAERFDLELHAATKLPLEGSHAALHCAACHEGASGAAQGQLAGVRGIEVPGAEQGQALHPGLDQATVPVWFAGLPDGCAACHQDAHGGYFAAHAGELAKTPHGSCAACHQSTHFAEFEGLAFDHGVHTGLPLEGSHSEASCEACHAPREQADENGRRFGSIEERFGRFAGCQSCHADPHGGAFADWSLAETGQPQGTDCAACHSASSFRHGAADFDHGQSTGYPLDGAHGRAACSSCHAPSRQSDLGPRLRPGPEDPLTALGLKPSASGLRQQLTPPRSLAGARGNACEDCHADAHFGQFAVEGRTACAACHLDVERFDTLDFDHDTDSVFPLDGAHKKAACGACHKDEPGLATQAAQAPTAPPGGRAAFNPARYKPLGTACTDCHAIEPGPLRKQ